MAVIKNTVIAFTASFAAGEDNDFVNVATPAGLNDKYLYGVIVNIRAQGPGWNANKNPNIQSILAEYNAKDASQWALGDCWRKVGILYTPQQMATGNNLEVCVVPEDPAVTGYDVVCYSYWFYADSDLGDVIPRELMPYDSNRMIWN